MSNDTFFVGGDGRGSAAASNNGTVTASWSGNSGDIASGTESQVQMKVGALTFDKGRVFILSHTGTITGIYGPRINGVNGNVAVSTNTTGEAEDTTHSDSVSAGDLVTWRSTGNSLGDSSSPIGPFGVHASGASIETYSCHVNGSGTWNHSGTANTFTPIMGRIGGADTSSEVNVQLKQRAPGSYTGLRVVCTANTIPATTTVTFRKGAASVNQTVAFSASTPATLEDTTHTDTVASGDLVDVLWSSGSATGSMTLTTLGETFSASAHLWDQFAYSTGLDSSNSAVTFNGPVGLADSTATTETRRQYRLRFATRVANLRGFWISNFSTTGAIVVRVNGVTGNCTVTPTASTGGAFEDTTHHDDIASGDLVTTQHGITTSIGWQEHVSTTWGLAANNASIGTVFGAFSQNITATNIDAAAIATVFGRFSQAAAVTVVATFRGPIATVFGSFSQAVNASDLGAGGTGIRQFWTF
jgi:hypothetical protein